MRESKKKQYYGALSFLIFVIIVALAYFLITPMIAETKYLNIQIGAKDRENMALTNKITALNKLSQAMTDNPDKVKMLDLGIPADDAQAEIIATLSNIASNAGMNVSSISQSSSEENDFTTINFVFESSYNGLKLFLESLEENIRFVKIGNLNMSRATKTDESEGYVSGTMNIDMFKYSDKATMEQNSEEILQEEVIQ